MKGPEWLRGRARRVLGLRDFSEPIATTTTQDELLRESGMTLDACPAGCKPEQGKGLRRVGSAELRLTPLMLSAAKMQDGDQILLCATCGRVYRRTFDSYLLQFRLEHLGDYVASQGQFEPKAWLQHEMKRLTTVNPGNASEK
jgi:hypothetical protein